MLTHLKDSAQINKDRTRAKRADLIAEELVRWARASGLELGSKLPQEKELIQMCGCSRGTLREALKVLEVKGLVSITTGPNGGARLTMVSDERAIALATSYLLFRDLAPEQLASYRREIIPILIRMMGGTPSQAEIEKLSELIEGQKKALAERPYDFASHSRFEQEFINALFVRLENPVARFHGLLINEVAAEIFAAVQSAPNDMLDHCKRTLAMFETMVGSFALSDFVRLSDEMRRHLVSAEQSLAGKPALSCGSGREPKIASDAEEASPTQVYGCAASRNGMVGVSTPAPDRKRQDIRGN